MSSYNNIEKIKYSKDTSEVVNLKEYIVFEDERAEEKYIVFKFVNNVNQQLLGMEFEVSQYDIDNALVESSIVIYDNFLAKANEDFVPKAKLKVNYACKTISIKLRKAAYDRFLWNEGEYEDNSYKFEHYYQDERRAPAPVAANNANKRKENKNTKRDGKKFELKNQTKKNVARFPAVFLAFVFIVVCVFVGVSLYFFKKDSDKFTIDGFKLRIVYENNVSIYGYSGNEKDIVIPEELGEYSVIKIESGAFTDCTMKTVTIDAPLSIEKYAFVNCKNLSSVSSTVTVTVMCAPNELCKGCTPDIEFSGANFIY